MQESILGCGEKRCFKCGEIKPLSAFGKCKQVKSGIHYRCRECISKYVRENKDKHKEHKRVLRLKYQKEHREELLEKKRIWRKNNRDRINLKQMERSRKRGVTPKRKPSKEELKARNHARYKARPKEMAQKYRERHNAWSKRHRKELSDKRKEYLRKNPLKRTQYRGTRRAKRNLAAVDGVLVSVYEISNRWSMFGSKCWICGYDAEQTDHVKPLSRGGLHVPSNLRPICKSCNSSKNDKWPLTEEVVSSVLKNKLYKLDNPTHNGFSLVPSPTTEP